MSKKIKIRVELNDGSGRMFSQIVPVPSRLPESVLDSYDEDQYDKWVEEYVRTMILVEWEIVR